ncbi:MAG: hypothetical protein ACXAC7_20165 [Candidatus Hodarchaeales archaeon]
MEFNFPKKLDYSWIVSASQGKISISVLNNKRKFQKKNQKLLKFIPDKPKQFESLVQDYFQFLLFHHLYHLLEAPFSSYGENSDKKRIHKAIWDGIAKAEPLLSKESIFSKVILCHSIIKDFIIDNRFFLENQDYQWVPNDIILVPYYNYLLEYNLPHINLFFIISYINTLLYCSSSLFALLEDNFVPDVANTIDRILRRFFGTKKHIIITTSRTDIETSRKLVTTNLLQFARRMRELFSGEDRYTAIQSLVEILSPFIDESLKELAIHDSLSSIEIMMDLFDRFTKSEQASFVQEIMDKVQPISHGLIGESNIELKVLHEFYKRNYPTMDIKGDHGIDQSIFHLNNQMLNLAKSSVLNRAQVEQFDLAKIDIFQRTYGIPILIPIENQTYLFNEYHFQTKKWRKVRYKKHIGELEIPDVLEIYLDKTGSMFFEEDEENRGFNDGSRYDISLSVMYAFIMALHQESQKQNKTCYVRFHSFSELQVSSPLISSQNFLDGEYSTLKVLFDPENGYDYENLNVEQFQDGLKRVYIIITDGDLVIEGRTAREASKLHHIATKSLNKVVLFEMEKQFSLGHAVQHDQNIITYSVKNKQQMFQQGIEVIISKNIK